MKMLILCLAIIVCSLQEESGKQESVVIGNDQIINQQVVQRKQQELQEQSIRPWVLQQLKHIKEIKEFPNAESFMIRLKPKGAYEFKWIPNSKKSPLKMMVMVFAEQRGSDLTVLKNPELDNYVAVQSKHISIEMYKLHVKVYISKIFTFDFNTKDRYIRVNNTHDSEIIVEISLEETQLYLRPWQAVKNDHFQAAVKQIQNVYDQMQAGEKSRSKIFKWEWGFLEREGNYEQEMLKITAFELLVILTAAFVQLYCVKTLFDQNSVV